MAQNKKSLFHAELKGDKLSNINNREWSQIDNFNLTIGETFFGQILITFNSLDTWNDKSGCGTTFRIILTTDHGRDILATGYYTVAEDGQRIPISIIAYADLSVTKKAKVVSVEWRPVSGGRSWIGSFGTTSLTATAFE